MDGLGTVYFEKNISSELSQQIRHTNPISLVNEHLGTESQLYFVRDVGNESVTPQVFDSALGSFMKNTFVLEMEYMFVQVGQCYHCQIGGD